MSLYEYVTIKLPGKLAKNADRLWTEELNEVAAHGWRLVSIDEHHATFERPKQ